MPSASASGPDERTPAQPVAPSDAERASAQAVAPSDAARVHHSRAAERRTRPAAHADAGSPATATRSPAPATARRRRRRRPLVLSLAGALALVLAIGAAAVLLMRDDGGGAGAVVDADRAAAAPPCADSAEVLVAPADAPFWQFVLDAYARATDSSCQSIELADLPPDQPDAAAVLADADGWIAEDLMSLEQLPADIAPLRADVIARSPIVLVSGGLATEAPQLLAPAAPLSVSLAAPAASAASALGLDALTVALTGQSLELTSSISDLSPDDQQLIATITAMHQVEDIAQMLAQPLDANAIVLATEAQAWRSAEAAPDGRAVLYLGDGGIQLQTPLVQLRASAQLDDLRAFLRTEQGGAAVAAVGLRPADGGEAPAARGSLAPLSPLPTPQFTDPARFVQHLGLFTVLKTPVSSLAAVDVSGSMNDPMPGGPARQTKIDLIRTVAAAMFQITPPGGRSGMITFHSDAGNRAAIDYAAPLAANDQVGQQDRLLAALGQPAGGGTPLYNTVVSAYQRALEGYAPGMPNQLVILTDGDNRDTIDTITLTQMAAQVQAMIDPRRPIQVTVIAFGQDADAQVVTSIADAVHGTPVLVPDYAAYGPALAQVFLPRS